MGRTTCLGAAGIALALAGLGQASAFWLPLDTLAHFTPQLLIASALHIFVSPGITASGVRLGEPGGSDHYPVIADLILPP
jgi:hypothetical protein